MTDKTLNRLSFGLLLIGTAASLWYLYKQNRGGGGDGFRRGNVGVRRIRQPNRDARLGLPNNRKFFGYSGTSSAQGSAAASAPPPSIGLFGSRRVIRPAMPAIISLQYRPRPAYRATQNGQVINRTVATAIPPGGLDEF